MDLEDLKTLFGQALTFQQEMDALQEKLDAIGRNLSRLENDTIPDAMRHLGLTAFSTQDKTFTLKKSFKARLTEEKTADAIAYLASNGFGDLIKAQVITDFGIQDTDSVKDIIHIMETRGLTPHLKNTVHPNTLGAFVRELDEKGELSDEIKDLLSVHTQYTVKVKTK